MRSSHRCRSRPMASCKRRAKAGSPAERGRPETSLKRVDRSRRWRSSPVSRRLRNRMGQLVLSCRRLPLQSEDRHRRALREVLTLSSRFSEALSFASSGACSAGAQSSTSPKQYEMFSKRTSFTWRVDVPVWWGAGGQRCSERIGNLRKIPPLLTPSPSRYPSLETGEAR